MPDWRYYCPAGLHGQADAIIIIYVQYLRSVGHGSICHIASITEPVTARRQNERGGVMYCRVLEHSASTVDIPAESGQQRV